MVSKSHELHDSLVASVATLLANREGRHSPEQQEVPDTSAPANTPVLTPSNSFPKTFVPDTNEETMSAARVQQAFSAGASSFSLSLLSDTSEDEDECNFSSLSCLDTLLCSRYVAPQRSSQPSQNIGLGITGIMRKNEQAPFDGLGLVGMHSSRKNPPQTEVEDNIYDAYGEVSSPLLISDESSGTLSESFFQEALLTFLEDPFHSQNVNSIPECKSWYEPEAVSQSPLLFHPESSQYHSARYHSTCHGIPTNLSDSHDPTKLKKHFSSATISSGLKRNEKAKSVSVHTSRGRSASWPTASNSPSLRDKNGNRYDRPVAPIPRNAWRM